MIPLTEINNLSQKFGVLAETIEKDYVISWILLCISRSMIKDDFIFYGGTAIKRIYFEEHRYSEDIDLLSKNKYSLDSLLKALSSLDFAQDQANLALKVNKNNIIATKGRAQIYITYDGYDEIMGSPKEIRLDFSMDMDINGKTVQRKIIESYSDMKERDGILSVMSLNAILASKLALLFEITRNEPRDLYDIWFLLQRMDKFDFDIDQINEAFRNRLSFYPSSTTLISQLNNVAIKRNWHARLSKQLDKLPEVEKVVKEIQLQLNMLF